MLDGERSEWILLVTDLGPSGTCLANAVVARAMLQSLKLLGAIRIKVQVEGDSLNAIRRCRWSRGDWRPVWAVTPSIRS
ncbi:hypothetical protein AMTR_s00182p00053390 [Amborella trichopoda]|uniref:Uncharacterized protein n=1 Tax=Amborella trichopoda TaxID=13333 RepID=U5D4J5_AMBTC|nr:hypothetical protein AMTR_s00182p00053390 [Amborella trichopoda]